MKTDQQQLAERYFVEVLGWDVETRKSLMQDLRPLPNIIDSFPEFKRWVIQEMGERGYRYLILDDGSKDRFCWGVLSQTAAPEPMVVARVMVPIKNDNITEAAIHAALETVEVQGESASGNS